ncbi:MAG: hypothetical protein V7K89_00245, partial [Nostoc sp.]
HRSKVSFYRHLDVDILHHPILYCTQAGTAILNYQLVAAHQLPLSSGAVESLIRQAVNLRMKGNSKFWLQDNAEIMLHLRCQLITGS